jgi:hypothetical protein
MGSTFAALDIALGTEKHLPKKGHEKGYLRKDFNALRLISFVDRTEAQPNVSLEF